MADYMALNQLRTYRRLFVTRFGALAAVFGLAGFGFHWMSPVASWFSVVLCTLAPASTWIAELRCDRRLARKLTGTPGRKS